MSQPLDFLLTRQSVPARMLGAPYPDRDQITELLTAAARVPDHGKLEPWRFIVLSDVALSALAAAITAAGPRLGMIPEKIAKAADTYHKSGAAVVVVSSPKHSDKVPAIEQVYSAGAVCLSLVNAAQAAGWGANWLSGVYMHDADFSRDNLGLAPHETVAGVIHLGTPKGPVSDRPRPDIAALTTWRDG